MHQHDWTEGDDLLALYVFRYGSTDLPLPLETMLRVRGIEPGSFRMRVGNFKALAGKGGLANAAKQSERIFKRYGNLEKGQLRALLSTRH